jgi:hypothetical protein
MLGDVPISISARRERLLMEYRIRRLRFTVSDADLNEALDLLAPFSPSFFHRTAWETLTSERARREGGEPPEDLRLMSGVYETLPLPVQRLLLRRGSSGTTPPRHLSAA